VIFLLQGFKIDWCKQPDIGLPRPDAVLYLTLSSEVAAKRGGFGIERYEQTDFQKKVASNFELLKDESWQVGRT
jgi:dTMP kinase